MNFDLNNLPERTRKPRNNGITMVMDKGMSTRQAQDFIEVAAPHTDIIKLGWSTALVTASLPEKLAIYRASDIPYYFGGTLFEAYVVRNQFDDYRRLLDRYQLTYAEVSDGSMELPHEEKCRYIELLSQQVTVISEVGSKDDKKVIAPYRWIELIKAELNAGAWKVIAEARESGNVGIYRETGEVRQGLIDEILTQIPQEAIIWEAPIKAQQVWFIKLLGSNVNLGNIAPQEVIPLETIRLGLRGDTFHHFLSYKG